VRKKGKEEGDRRDRGEERKEGRKYQNRRDGER